MLKKRSNSDGVIVREVLKGDRERFDGLVERHLPAVYATALAHTRNAADAEDVVQDTFLNAFTALDRLRAPGRFGPWVITIARNTALKHLRRKRVAAETAEETPGEESPLSSAQRKEFGVFLSEAITELPEGDREAILLHYFSGKSAREVAQALGVSRSAVLKRLERGRARLGKHLLDRLGDEETVRDALRPSIYRVTRGIALAAVTWETSKSLTAGSVLAASLSVLPKAGTVAACLAGMGFMAVIGWNYLKSDAVEQVEAVPEPLAASRAEAESTVQDNNAPEASTVPATPVEQDAELIVAMQTEPEGEPVAEPVPSESTTTVSEESTEAFTTIDGFWDFAPQQNAALTVYFGRVELSGAGGGLRVLSMEGNALDMIQNIVRAARHVEIKLEDEFNSCTLVGDFNEALTEIILEGVFHTLVADELWEELPLTMVGTRVSAEELSREEQIEAFKITLRNLYDKIKAYAAEHGGEFPEELDALYPQYLSDRSTIESNATRSLVYRRPPSLQFGQDTGEASYFAITETDPDELMKIEYYLQDLWGELFLIKVPVLESVHRELEVHLQVSVRGKVTEVTDAEESETDGTVSEAQARAQNAACSNNLKQIGLACRMFENEQAVKFMPPGFRALHPEYLVDTRILTCPGAEPGTESYELLFPATTAAYMVELASRIEGLSEEVYSSFLRSRIPIVLERHECSGLEGRNILFLDGHVEMLKNGEWESIVEPYLQY